MNMNNLDIAMLIRDISDFMESVKTTMALLKKFQFPKDIFNLKKYINATDELNAKWEVIKKKYKF